MKILPRRPSFVGVSGKERIESEVCSGTVYITGAMWLDCAVMLASTVSLFLRTIVLIFKHIT